MKKYNKINSIKYGSTIRKIIRSSKTAVLSSNLKDSGWPFGSLVLSCCEQDGTPYLFISDLAEHTKAIKSNNKISIFYENCRFLDTPLTGVRFSVMARVHQSKKKEKQLLLDRFVLHHPDALVYSKFDDFNIFQLDIEKIHVIAGFGKIFWLDKEDVIINKHEELILCEKQIINSLNDKNLCAYKIIGIDPEGFDFTINNKYHRKEFSRNISDPQKIKTEILKNIKKINIAEDL